MGRRKVAQFRHAAEAAGWLDVAMRLPGGPELAVHLGWVRTQPASPRWLTGPEVGVARRARGRRERVVAAPDTAVT